MLPKSAINAHTRDEWAPPVRTSVATSWRDECETFLQGDALGAQCVRFERSEIALIIGRRYCENACLKTVLRGTFGCECVGLPARRPRHFARRLPATLRPPAKQTVAHADKGKKLSNEKQQTR